MIRLIGRDDAVSFLNLRPDAHQRYLYGIGIVTCIITERSLTLAPFTLRHRYISYTCAWRCSPEGLVLVPRCRILLSSAHDPVYVV